MYQTMSPDDMTSTTSTINIRKSNINNSFKSSNKEDENNIENGTFEGNNNSNGLMSNQNQQPSSSMDMVLQWGPRKRSRCSRTEGRSMVSLVLDKHTSKTASSTRVKPHGLLFLSSKSRNLADQMGTNSETPSRNGGGGSRPISRSTVGKRSPSYIEKNDNISNKKVSSSGTTIRKVKSDDSLVPNGNGNHHDLAHGGPASTVVRSPVGDAEKTSEVIQWPRIYLSLSRKEKEDDFYAMKGTKLPHRPKKRAKAVDRALQYCFPGLWLSDLTRARYEVRERKSINKKPRRRGLKGLENMESESE